MTHAIQQTSLFAFQEVRQRRSPSLGDRRKCVLEALKAHDNMTDRELKEHLKWEINSVVPRRNELVKSGLVAEAGRRVCRITGRTCIAWRALKATVTPYSE